MRPKAPFELYLTLCPVTKSLRLRRACAKVQTRHSLSLLAYTANYRHLSQHLKHWYSALSSEYKNDQTRQTSLLALTYRIVRHTPFDQALEIGFCEPEPMQRWFLARDIVSNFMYAPSDVSGKVSRYIQNSQRVFRANT